jgi:hypothetical protein
MAESSFSNSFKDLYQDVLRYQGQNPSLTSGSVWESAKRRTNDAYRRFLSIDWSWNTSVEVLQVEHGKNEYELPDEFSTLKTSFRLFPYMGWINPQEIPIGKLQQFQGFYPRTGIPLYFAVKTTYTPQAGVRYTVIFYPTPHINLSYNYEYRVLPNILVNDTDIPFCPGDVSLVLRAFCLSEVEAFDEEGAKSTWTNLLFQTLLPQALSNDAKKRPITAGSMNVGADDYSAGNWPTQHAIAGNTIQIGGGGITPM